MIEALDRTSAEMPQFDVSASQPRDGGCREDGVRVRELFHPCRQMRRSSYRSVVHMEVRADRADYDVARVQTHTDRDRNGIGPTAYVPAHRVLERCFEKVRRYLADNRMWLSSPLTTSGELR